MIKPQLHDLLISRPGDGVWSLWHQNFKKSTSKNLVAATKWRLVKHLPWSLTSPSCLSTQRLWDLSILGQLSWKSCGKYILGCWNACRDPHTYSFLLGILSAPFPLPWYGLGIEKEHVRFQITTFVASIVALVELIHSYPALLKLLLASFPLPRYGLGMAMPRWFRPVLCIHLNLKADSNLRLCNPTEFLQRILESISSYMQNLNTTWSFILDKWPFPFQNEVSVFQFLEVKVNFVSPILYPIPSLPSSPPPLPPPPPPLIFLANSPVVPYAPLPTPPQPRSPPT